MSEAPHGTFSKECFALTAHSPPGSVLLPQSMWGLESLDLNRAKRRQLDGIHLRLWAVSPGSSGAMIKRWRSSFVAESVEPRA